MTCQWAIRRQSPPSSPPDTCGTNAACSSRFRLIVPRNRAVMCARLTKRRKEKRLEPAVLKQIEELRHMTVTQLRQKYLEVVGQESRSGHKQYLFRRIAWQLQALAEGGLSERARRRALEIANDADLRIRAPKHLAKAGIRTADHSGCVS